MIEKIKQNRIQFFFALLGGIVFTLAPVFIKNVVNNFAPISHWVDIQSVTVSDLDRQTTFQDILFQREVKRELNGYPRQELFLVEVDGTATELISTPKDKLADYEPTDDDAQKLPYDFWEKKGLKEAIQDKTTVGERYYWVWVIEFIKPNGDSVIERYESNEFKVI